MFEEHLEAMIVKLRGKFVTPILTSNFLRADERSSRNLSFVDVFGNVRPLSRNAKRGTQVSRRSATAVNENEAVWMIENSSPIVLEYLTHLSARNPSECHQQFWTSIVYGTSGRSSL
jgi:hypothetical protein